jgi:BMFP domain-containing protein YqiC
MSDNRRILDDVAKLATSAAGLVQGAGREAESLLRQRLERLLDRMALVTREDFDVVKAMAAKARTENEVLAARLTALETAIQAGNAKRTLRAASTRPGGGAVKGQGKAVKKAKKPPKTAKK